MTDMVEGVARAVAAADWRSEIEEASEPSRWLEAADAYDLTNNNGRFRYDQIAIAAIEAIGQPAMAMARIHAAIAKRLHPSSAMTDREFIDEILAAADDKEVVRAVRAARGADSQDAPLSPSEGAAPQAKP